MAVGQRGKRRHARQFVESVSGRAFPADAAQYPADAPVEGSCFASRSCVPTVPPSGSQVWVTVVSVTRPRFQRGRTSIATTASSGSDRFGDAIVAPVSACRTSMRPPSLTATTEPRGSERVAIA
jgi:hypothetical protein